MKATFWPPFRLCFSIEIFHVRLCHLGLVPFSSFFIAAASCGRKQEQRHHHLSRAGTSNSRRLAVVVANGPLRKISPAIIRKPVSLPGCATEVKRGMIALVAKLQLESVHLANVALAASTVLEAVVNVNATKLIRSGVYPECFFIFS